MAELPSSAPRRDFLRLAGFSFASAALAGCGRGPMQKVVPHLVQPEEMTPGVATWYASLCAGCSAGCGILAKVRDGRPVKIEGNAEHPLSRGGICAVGQAMVLGLYDSERLSGPRVGGNETSWARVDGEILPELQKLADGTGEIRFLTSTVTSPTTQASIDGFLARFGARARHVVCDALSASAILDAHERTHGARLLPHHLFDKATVIVSLDADFLGTWISPVEHAAGYAAMRRLDGEKSMSHHLQFESRMSLTGANADHRVAVAPAGLRALAAHLASALMARAGHAAASRPAVELPVAQDLFDRAVERLWKARGRSLLVCGVNDVDMQVLVNASNHALGNYGGSIDIEKPSFQKKGRDSDSRKLLEEIESGSVRALFVHGLNPVYDLPEGERWKKAIGSVGLSVSFAERVDETSSVTRYIAPDHHPLESWSDAEATAGLITIQQPAVRPLRRTRSVRESLAAWSGRPSTDFQIVRGSWEEKIAPRRTAEDRALPIQAFWERSVHDGFAQVNPVAAASAGWRADAVAESMRALGAAPSGDGFDLVLHPTVGLQAGAHAHNPWLQELPDPVTKMTWDNAASIAPGAAAKLGLAEGDMIAVSDGALRIDLPVHVQPGQDEGTVAVALGFGRMGTERFSRLGPKWLFARATAGAVGVAVSGFRRIVRGEVADDAVRVQIARIGGRRTPATTQHYHSLLLPQFTSGHDHGEGHHPLGAVAAVSGTPEPVATKTGHRREEIVVEKKLSELGGHAANAPHGGPHGKQGDLWPDDHPYHGHKWGLVVDLNVCTGCSACVVGCQAENNVPVVGRDEVERTRIMHWLRIDRYYGAEGDAVNAAHQPMMCQHCDHAPCETVCPVLATVHSSEGLNQQVYNRCVGTRYCANNCPYKVRRFNWFEYARDDRLQNMVLNPDVTVRSRGIMEKCSFCIQRIAAARATAQQEGREIRDDEIQPACQQSCPAGAIVFGDRNDPQSRVSKLAAGERAYHALEELNVLPAVTYLAKVRNDA